MYKKKFLFGLTSVCVLCLSSAFIAFTMKNDSFIVRSDNEDDICDALTWDTHLFPFAASLPESDYFPLQ